MKYGFRLSGKLCDVLKALAALAELEWEFPNLLAQLDGKVLKMSPGAGANPVGEVAL